MKHDFRCPRVLCEGVHPNCAQRPGMDNWKDCKLGSLVVL